MAYVGIIDDKRVRLSNLGSEDRYRQKKLKSLPCFSLCTVYICIYKRRKNQSLFRPPLLLCTCPAYRHKKRKTSFFVIDAYVFLSILEHLALFLSSGTPPFLPYCTFSALFTPPWALGFALPTWHSMMLLLVRQAAIVGVGCIAAATGNRT